MQPKELLNILSQLQVKGLDNLDKLKICGLKRWLPPESNPISDSKVLQQKIKEFAPEQGWLCFQSKVKYFCQQDFCKDKSMPDSGILLYGEVVNTQGQSLHIREDEQGGWILTYFEETEGDNYLVEDTEFLGEKDHAPEKLLYHVYWQYDEEQGYRQFAARFKGFA